MSTGPEPQPGIAERLKSWIGKLVDDPIGTLMDSALWLFMLAIGVFIVALFCRMGWEMIRGAWK